MVQDNEGHSRTTLKVLLDEGEPKGKYINNNDKRKKSSPSCGGDSAEVDE